MIDISGYGILRDDWYQELSGGEWYPQPVLSKDLLEYYSNIYEQNIKSLYIEASPNDKPIIDVKSLSAQSYRIQDIMKKISYSFRYNYENVVDDVTSTEERKEIAKRIFEDLNNKSLFDIYKAYNFKEEDLLPIRNYDLLDIENNSSIETIPFDKTVFYDKLILGENDRLALFKNIGQLYNISPANIPTLTKLVHISIQDIDLKFDFNKTSLNPLFTVLGINKVDDKLITFNIWFKVKPHFRDIKTTYVNNINAYIPTTFMFLQLVINIDELRSAISLYLNSKNKDSFNYSYNGIELRTARVFILDDLDFIAFRIYHAFINLSDISGYGSDICRYDIDNINEPPHFVHWPFGNVYDTAKPCMTMTNVLMWSLRTDSIVNNNFTLNLNHIIHGFYNDFMGSEFNRDLLSANFFRKDDYIKYLDFRDTFADKSDGFNLFKKEIQDMNDAITDKLG